MTPTQHPSTPSATVTATQPSSRPELDKSRSNEEAEEEGKAERGVVHNTSSASSSREEDRPQAAKGVARHLGTAVADRPERSPSDNARDMVVTSRRRARGDEAEGEEPKEELEDEERQGVRWATERALGICGTDNSAAPAGNSWAPTSFPGATHAELSSGDEELRRSIACRYEEQKKKKRVELRNQEVDEAIPMIGEDDRVRYH